MTLKKLVLRVARRDIQSGEPIPFGYCLAFIDWLHSDHVFVLFPFHYFVIFWKWFHRTWYEYAQMKTDYDKAMELRFARIRGEAYELGRKEGQRTMIEAMKIIKRFEENHT